MTRDSESARRTLWCLRVVLIAAMAFAASRALAADRIRIAAQKTGTLAWELEVLHAHDLDRQAGLAIETTSSRAPRPARSR